MISSKASIINTLSKHYCNGNDAEFARMLGIKPQVLSNWKARDTIDYEVIYTKCVGINPEWLLTGVGEMLKGNAQAVVPLQPPKHGRISRPIAHQYIPLYDIKATASIVHLVAGTQPIPIDEIYIPNMPKCDGALPITGDSMYPVLKSGDVVLYKLLNDVSNVSWGEMYLVAISHNGDDFFTAKYVQKSDKDGWVKLVSHNQHHQTKEFPLSSIIALAHIKAHIRYNSSY